MNLQKMMKQAQQMQQKMMDMQQQLAEQAFEGKAGGGMVTATVSGKGVALRFNVDASLLQPSEKEMLEDLLVAAFNDAKHKADDAANAEMGKLTGGMGLPSDFKLPF